MIPLIDRLLQEDVFFLTMLCITVVLIVGIKTLGSTIKAASRERTRREIAAYIAEGTMTPEQGERLMRSGESSTKMTC